MQDSHSTEKASDLHGETDRVAHCRFCLPICDSLVEPLMAILRFLGFEMDAQNPHGSSSAMRNGNGAHRPIPSSPEFCYTAGSDQPPTAANPDESGRRSGFRRRVPPPPRSTGGGGQTD